MGALEDLYQESILERARHPAHQRRLEPFDTEMREVNPLCGDRVVLRLRCDEAGRIAAIGYEARACAICLASSDFLAELVPGMAGSEALGMGQAFERALRSPEAASWSGCVEVLRLFEPLRETPSRIGCATLPWHALARALAKEAKTDG